MRRERFRFKLVLFFVTVDVTLPSCESIRPTCGGRPGS